MEDQIHSEYGTFASSSALEGDIDYSNQPKLGTATKKFVLEEKKSACIISTCSIRLLELLVYVEGGARCSQLIKWAWLDVISQ